MFEIFVEPDVRSLCLESCHGNRQREWNLAGAPLVAHDHPRATWTRRPKCPLHPDLMIMLPGFCKALHFVIMFAIIDIHLFWYCCVLPSDIKVGCPLKTVAGKRKYILTQPWWSWGFETSSKSRTVSTTCQAWASSPWFWRGTTSPVGRKPPDLKISTSATLKKWSLPLIFTFWIKLGRPEACVELVI